MNVILGATGQIGSMLVDNLLSRGQQVRAVIRNELKAQEFINKGAEVAIADFFDEKALTQAMLGGHTVFLLTPENPRCTDFLEEIQTLINNYKKAIANSDIARIVGLSSMGAQYGLGMGNLSASYLLEQAFEDYGIEQIFVRPAYYFSNWLGELNTVQEQGVLPTFFPPELKFPMVAPADVADLLASVMTGSNSYRKINEISNLPYSSLDIAETFEDVLGKKIELKQILPQEWETTLLQAGFSEDAAKNFMLMTQSVFDGKAKPTTAVNQVRALIGFKEYVESVLQLREKGKGNI